ncbi:hypothetical protein QO179_08285 [Bacillus stercoris]|nr:hypothetical protein [Bacillus stercoris]
MVRVSTKLFAFNNMDFGTKRGIIEFLTGIVPPSNSDIKNTIKKK